MEKLVPELYLEIIEWIIHMNLTTNLRPKAMLPQYAVISRQWRDCIEKYTFRDIRLKTNDLETFAQLFVGANIPRRKALQRLSIEFILPDPPKIDGCCDVENVPDRQQDSLSFSASVRELFAILRDLENRLSGNFPLRLIFEGAFRPYQQLWGPHKRRDPCEGHERYEVHAARTASGQFELVDANLLPVLYGVDSFHFQKLDRLEELRPTWMPDLLRRLPGVKHLLLRGQDLYTFGRTRRQMDRQYLSRSLCCLPMVQLTTIIIDIDHSKLRHDDIPLHVLVEPGNWRCELWSVVISRWADFPHLRKLYLLGELVVCPEFFRNITEHEGVPFPSLQEFVFEFAMDTADGHWFYKRDDEAFARARADPDPELEEFWEEHQEEFEDDRPSDFDMWIFGDGPDRTDVVHYDVFRTLPDRDIFEPFIHDASGVVKCLPKLQKFSIIMADRAGGIQYPFVRRKFELWWLKSGEPISPLKPETTIFDSPQLTCDKTYIKQNRLYWRTATWVPWRELQAVWSEAAGPDAKIVFLDEEHWSPNGGRGGRGQYSSYYYGEF